jgi:methyl-accepting chemotaxis protein
MNSQLKNLVIGTTLRGKFYRALVTLCILMLAVTGAFVAYSQNRLVEQLVGSQTVDLANSYFDNINTLMLTGGMANKEIARAKVLTRPEVVDARIIRAPRVVELYGPGSDYARPRDTLDRRALEGEAIHEIGRNSDGRVLTVLYCPCWPGQTCAAPTAWAVTCPPRARSSVRYGSTIHSRRSTARSGRTSSATSA